MRPLPVILLLTAASISTAAHAGDYYDQGGSTYLELGGYHTVFRYPDGDHEAHVGRFGLAFDQPVAEDLGFTLVGGYLDMTVDGEPAAASLDYTGRYLGLGLRYEGTQGDYLNLTGELSYTWHDVTASGLASAQSDITWYETWASFGPVLRWQRWRLGFGGYYQDLDGTQTDDVAPGRQSFDAGKSAGAYLSLGFYVDDTGSVTLMGTAGARKGIKLVFKRDF